MGNRAIDHYVAGAMGGTTGYFVGYPLDTIKVQLQTQTLRGDSHGLVSALSTTWNRGVAGGFYRGLSWPLLSTGLVNSIFYGVYGNTLTFLEPDKTKQKSAYRKIFLAGSVAGAVQALPIIPIEYVKVVLQSQISMREDNSATKFKGASATDIRYFKGPTDCAASVVRTRGVAGLFKGATATFPREIFFFGNYCLIYEYLSESIKQKKWTDSRGFLADFLGGGFAGSLSWIFVIPFDVIKSRFQADFRGEYSSPVDCAKKSFMTEGVGVFYKGCVVICLRAFPVCAVSFMVYAQTIQWINRK